MSDSRRWRAVDPLDIAWIGWEESFVAYHRPSGKTHFLNAFSHWLLTEFLIEPTTLGEVQSATSDDANAGEISALLERFEELGLLVRV